MNKSASRRQKCKTKNFKPLIVDDVANLESSESEQKQKKCDDVTHLDVVRHSSVR